MRAIIGYGLELTTDDIIELFPQEVEEIKKECKEDEFGYFDCQEILETYLKDANIKTELIDFDYTVDENKDPKHHHVIYFTLHRGKGHYQGKISMLPQILEETVNRVEEFKTRYPIFNGYEWKLLFMTDAEK